MSVRAIRNDVSHLITGGLLLVGTITAVTGLVSDLWDLNDFVYHKYAGYVLAGLSFAHVLLHWGRLVAYARWRLGRPATHRMRSAASSLAQPSRPPSVGTANRSPAGSVRGLPDLPIARGTQARLRQAALARSGVETSRASMSPAHGLALRTHLSRRSFLGLVLGGLGGLALGRSVFRKAALPYGADVGAIFHEWSKPRLLSLLGTVANWGYRPAPYKRYEGAEQVSLPPPGDARGLYTEEAIEQRRSVRDYSSQPTTLRELSRLLYYTGGINGERWGHGLRAAPSAGALYPIETYLVVHRVEGLKPGLYHYGVQDHALDVLRIGDLRSEIVHHGLMQEFLGGGNVVMVLTAIFQRLRWKYHERAYRYALLEAGHLGQNVYLAATSMGMGACAVGAFLDDDLNEMLAVDGRQEAAVYMLSVGKV